MITEKYNELPRPTFRWMKVNHLELPQLKATGRQKITIQERHEGDVSVTFYEGDGKLPLGDFTGAGADSLQEAVGQSMTGCAITGKAGGAGKVWLTYSLSQELPQIVGQLKISAPENSKLEVYLTFDGDAENGSVNLLEYVDAAEAAAVKICKVQLHGEQVRHVEHRYARSGKNSSIDYVSAEVGSKAAIVYYKTDLTQREGVFSSKAMYLGSRDQILDFSYWVPQEGEKTKTDILTTGALMDTAKKYFRGTIDFLRGCKKAAGSESDICLLLSPDVHSISLPLLLCKEDDVVGDHASSAGQIDKDMLYYLMSRGFNREGAQLIIVESNIRPVIDSLGDTDMENKVLQAVRDKMEFCRQKGDCNDKCTKRFPHLD
ncbi:MULTISPECIES: SufB/SufD family protein [Megasphaera]|uniref:SufB/sufD domain protein n=1 Tax=Megasphaera vaginalis (ex Srinivasan et al. 2021) TaxID=1111454 RepID=U7UPI8_9FIRM|nr:MULTISPECIES: SufD family Fe-S cluster assembly protein [Megasphaera]ERT60398.1 SufB/sufD domain protein [Megasphaera vaginalis (ex Srinivasan et al. 2021)]